MLKQALQYVKNTGGCATKEIFMDDHEPIGQLLWDDLSGLVTINTDGYVVLTQAGEDKLRE
jgi:hypothetical protein